MSNCKKLQQYLAQNPEKAQGLEWPERPNPENVPPVTPDPVEPSQEMIEAQKRVDHQDDQCPDGTTRHPEDKRKSDGSLICLTAAQLDRYNSRHAAAAEVEPDTITQGIFDEPAVPAEKQDEPEEEYEDDFEDPCEGVKCDPGEKCVDGDCEDTYDDDNFEPEDQLPQDDTQIIPFNPNLSTRNVIERLKG